MGTMEQKMNQKQFKRGTVPQQPVDEWDRRGKPEPSSPSKARKRQGVKLGSQTEARPGLVGMQDYKRSKR
jgi:hypothetical protein